MENFFFWESPSERRDGRLGLLMSIPFHCPLTAASQKFSLTKEKRFYWSPVGPAKTTSKRRKKRGYKYKHLHHTAQEDYSSSCQKQVFPSINLNIFSFEYSSAGGPEVVHRFDFLISDFFCQRGKNCSSEQPDDQGIRHR